MSSQSSPTFSPVHCGRGSHWSRRGLLQTLAGGVLLSPVSRLLAEASNSPSADPARPRSVILLWLQGGPSQLETFDPHPKSPGGGLVKPIPTSVPGLQIADTLPRLAEQMHSLALLRSVVGNEGDHERAIYQIKSGYRPDPTLVHPAFGAILCHQSDLGAEIPRHISILPAGSPGRGGYLSAQYDAFQVNDPASPVPDVQRGIDTARYDARIKDLMDVLEPRFARRRLVDLDRARTMHVATTRSALTMMTSDQLAAFDLQAEPAELRESFGDTPFGRGCLAAIRLIEVGVRCVEVTLTGWDSHINNHALQTAGCSALDPAAAALIEELRRRDLLDTTLVVIAGEFGRTPSINPAEGRDHWVHGFSIALGGCGIRGGVVHGETAAERNPDDPAAGIKDPVSVADVHATMLSALGIDPELELQTPIKRPMKLSEGTPIAGLIDRDRLKV